MTKRTTHQLSNNVRFILILGSFVTGACASESGGESGSVTETDGSDASDATDGSDVPSLGLEFVTAFDTSLRLSELTTPQTDRLCEELSTTIQKVPADVMDFLCLAQGVDAAQMSSDPVETCDKMAGLCRMVPFGASSTGGCRIGMIDRTREECVNPTVAEFIACELENLDLQAMNVALRTLPCSEAALRDTLRPKTLRDCACGTPGRIGKAPVDDLDWDYILNDADRCPETDHGYVVSDVGCAWSQDGDFDGVPNELDVCGSPTPVTEAVSDVGCTDAEDADHDGVPDSWDLCLGTAPGASPLLWGCSKTQDEDFDGVPNEADWCPFTPEDSGQLYGGCAESQNPPWKENILTEKPADVTPVVLGAGSPEAVTLHVLPSGLTTTASGSSYAGTVLLEIPGRGYQILTNADLMFEGTDPATPTAISGTMPIPIPSFGLFEALKLESPAKCEIGWGLGSSDVIAAVGLPVNPDRFYLYGKCGLEFSGILGMINIDYDGFDTEFFTVVIDPTDPGLFVRANLTGLRAFGPLEDVAVGFSTNGYFEQVPDATWEAEAHLPTVNGHLKLIGKLPINVPLLPQIVSVDAEGEAVVDLDANDDGVGLFGPIMDIRAGVIGEIVARLKFFKSEEVGLVLGKGSLGVVISDAETGVAFSGEVSPSELKLPISLPLAPTGNAIKVAAHVSQDISESYLVAEGKFEFLGSKIDLPVIPNLLDVSINARVTLTTDGLKATGTLDSAIHPWLEFTGGLDFEAELAWDLSHFHVQLTGNMSFDLPTGVEAALDLYLGSDDIRVNGESFPFF